MYFVFEKQQDDLMLNLVACTDLNDSGIGRVTVSPVALTSLRLLRTEAHLYRDLVLDINVSFLPPKDVSQKYIIPVGVAHSPYDWCGPDTFNNGYDEKYPERKNLFHYINEQYLADIRSGRAYLLIDQTHEGYQSSWLWEWFHNSCNEFNIHPKQVIYLTGNMDCEDQYTAWADKFSLEPRLKVVAHPHFEFVISEIAQNYSKGTAPGLIEKRILPNFDYQLNYKTNNLENIKTFNVLQKRTRAYRLWFFKHIYDAGLVEDNIITMNTFKASDTYYENRNMSEDDVEELHKVLPLFPKENPTAYTSANFESGDGGVYVLSLNDQTMLDSWCTVVSEASYGDSEGACFISEKTFKPIVCQHPFMVLGSKGTLKHLRELGYKTFEGFIDESYDDLSTWDRMTAITKEMVRIHNMTTEEKLEWYKGMQNILEHNYSVLCERWAGYVRSNMTLIKDYVEG